MSFLYNFLIIFFLITIAVVRDFPADGPLGGEGRSDPGVQEVELSDRGGDAAAARRGRQRTRCRR